MLRRVRRRAAEATIQRFEQRKEAQQHRFQHSVVDRSGAVPSQLVAKRDGDGAIGKRDSSRRQG